MSDFMTELITQDYLSYKLQKSGYDFESFSIWPTVYCHTCKAKLETDVFTRCYTCNDANMFTVPEEKSDEAPCQREIKLTREICDFYQNHFEKRFKINTANINPNKATVQITFLQEADNLFTTETNWKGIVYLLILSGVLATRCAEKGYISEVRGIQRITSWYINDKLEPWIKEYGGWECLFKRFEIFRNIYDDVRKRSDRILAIVLQKFYSEHAKHISEEYLEENILVTRVKGVLGRKVKQGDKHPRKSLACKRPRVQQMDQVPLLRLARKMHKVQQMDSGPLQSWVRKRPRVQHMD